MTTLYYLAAITSQIMVIDFDKHQGGLVPAIVQDAVTKTVLMLGYMSKEAYEKTISTRLVTFYSRSKKRLWTKGEESQSFLKLVDIKLDCDSDTLLVKADPQGPTCHKGTDTCWGETNAKALSFLVHLEEVIKLREVEVSPDKSYVKSLFQKGINKIAQKVGEEAVELVIEAKDNNDTLFLNEAADLLFHYMILLRAKGFALQDISDVLEKRHNS